MVALIPETGYGGGKLNRAVQANSGGAIFPEATMGWKLLGAGGGITLAESTRGRSLPPAGGSITLVEAARLDNTRAERVGSATVPKDGGQQSKDRGRRWVRTYRD